MSNILLINKYLQLKRLCRNHSLLDLIKVDGSKINTTSDFYQVYESENPLLCYFNDLNSAIKEEKSISYLLNQRK